MLPLFKSVHQSGLLASKYDDNGQLNSHPAKAPHMALLVMHYEHFRNDIWGWSSRKVCLLSIARLGFETDCNGFFYFCACFDRRDSYVDFL